MENLIPNSSKINKISIYNNKTNVKLDFNIEDILKIDLNYISNSILQIRVVLKNNGFHSVYFYEKDKVENIINNLTKDLQNILNINHGQQ